MIDINSFSERLASAVTEAVPTGRERPAPGPPRRAPRKWAPASMSVAELLELGLIDDAEVQIAATTDKRDALTWATMRALLYGHRDEAAAALGKLRDLAASTGDPEADARYRVQRFWATFEWGGDDERYDVLGHCRERAYRFDDLLWWGHLTLLLAVMGKHDEAGRAFDEGLGLLAGVAKDRYGLDVLTNLIEGAALLGDAVRVAAAGRVLRGPEDRLVVVGPGVVCKGSVERYRALVHMASGRWTKAEECFRRAEALHGEIGAGLLLARTRRQAASPLVAA